jgi:hypothetical protein
VSDAHKRRGLRGLLTSILERIRYGGRWVDLVADPGHRPEYTIKLYHALVNRGVRARYRVVGVGGGPGTPIGSVGQTIKIIVHRDDLGRAREIQTRLDA